jgi:ubiquitin C-terminal hydrolase
MNDKHAFSPGEKDWFYDCCLPETTRRRWVAREEHTSSLNDFIENLHGFKIVRVAPTNKTTIFTYNDKGKQKDVVSVTWIAPWAIEAWNKADYIQLDCSFRGTKPYVYCVPQAIIGNEAIPLGFIMTPSECSETYDWWFADLQQSNPDKEVKRKIILSDEGAALQHFGLRFAARHYFCHRHIIEKFGAKGLLGELVRQALEIQTNATYQALRPQLRANADQFLKDRRITEEAHADFVAFLSFYFPHGIWHRAADGVARCSNHAESFHGHVNRKLKGLRTLAHRLHAITKYIYDRVDKYQKEPRRQAHRKINALVLQAKDIPGVHTCDHPDCIAYQKDMARRYQLDSFPCLHCAKYWQENCEAAEFAKRPLPLIDFLTIGTDELHVENHKLFKIQTTSEKFQAYRRRKATKAAPRQHVPDQDEIRNHPGVAEEDFEGSHIQVDSIPEYPAACRVLAGVLHIASCRADPPRAAITHWVMGDWIRGFTEFCRRHRTPLAIMQWIARFTAYYWGWAHSGDLEKQPSSFRDSEPPDSTDHAGADGTSGASVAPGCTAASSTYRSFPIPLIDYTVDWQVDPSSAEPPDPGVGLPHDPHPAPDPAPVARSRAPPRSLATPLPPFPMANLGNTCFINCCLQCLHHIDALTDYFVGPDSVRHYVGLPALYQTLQNAIADRVDWRVSASINTLARFLSWRCSQGEQHDIHEWMGTLLDGLQEQLGSKGDPTRNIITRLFSGQFRTTLTCPRRKCRKQTLKNDPFNIISCPLPAADGDLYGCLECFSRQQTLDKDNRWKCTWCKCPVCASFTTHLEKLPPVLIIHLKRHVYANGTVSKLATAISFPLEFDVPYVLPGPNGFATKKYHLRALAEHLSFGGSTGANSGHYIAHVRRGDNWFRCNDGSVTFSSERSVRAVQPYVLFYEASPN